MYRKKRILAERGIFVNRLKRIIYVLLQCTWGLPTTLIGLGFFLANRKKHEHTIYRGCIDTHWNHYGGLSLGLFIFTPKKDAWMSQPIRVHEYGHTIQSMVLGPLMLFVGIISVTWGNLPYYAKKRKEKKLPYTACFVEWWASKWGELVTKEKAVWQ